MLVCLSDMYTVPTRDTVTCACLLFLGLKNSQGNKERPTDGLGGNTLRGPIYPVFNIKSKELRHSL